jgi:hypothetical protein
LLHFYVPLSLTEILLLLVNPIGSAAMGRMPLALESLAAWPVVASVGYITRGFGGAFNEVVVALIEERYSTHALRRFGLALAAASTGLLLLPMIPPVGELIFTRLLGLAEPLPRLVRFSILYLLPLPALTVLQSYLQGVILHSRRTRAITESVTLFLVLSAAVLVVGAVWGTLAGVYFALMAFTLGEALRTGWLWFRSRRARAALSARDCCS